MIPNSVGQVLWILFDSLILTSILEFVRRYLQGKWKLFWVKRAETLKKQNEEEEEWTVSYVTQLMEYPHQREYFYFEMLRTQLDFWASTLIFLIVLAAFFVALIIPSPEVASTHIGISWLWQPPMNAVRVILGLMLFGFGAVGFMGPSVETLGLQEKIDGFLKYRIITSILADKGFFDEEEKPKKRARTKG